jgi:probable O-glycosylation ligase (exosortase A-associated)
VDSLHWSAAFVAFLVYLWVVVTYKLPLGTGEIAMAVALLTLPLERTRFVISPVVAWTVALFAWACVGLLTTEYPTLVVQNLRDFAKIGAIALVAVNVITSRARLRAFTLFFLISFLLFPVRGAFMMQFTVGGVGLGRAGWIGSYGNPNDLATFCLLQLALVLSFMAVERNRWLRYAIAGELLVLPLLIAYTGSRAGTIASAAFFLIAFGKSLWKPRILAGLGVVAALVWLVVPHTLFDRISTIGKISEASSSSLTAAQGSTASRLEIWKVATAISRDHPVTGVGLGAYSVEHGKYALRSGFDPIARGNRDAHSTYLRLSAELGIPGLLCFLGLVSATLIEAERVRRQARRVLPKSAAQLGYLEIGLIAYLVAGIWASLGMYVFTYLHLALIHVTARLVRAELRRTPSAGAVTSQPRVASARFSAARTMLPAQP